MFPINVNVVLGEILFYTLIHTFGILHMRTKVKFYPLIALSVVTIRLLLDILMLLYLYFLLFPEFFKNMAIFIYFIFLSIYCNIL